MADGDTISVLHDGVAETIRLNGIDAPEDGQAFSTRAKQFTSASAFGQIVTVKANGQDRNGRTVADVILPDGRSLSHEIVRAGFAWWFWRYSTDQRLTDLEAEAPLQRLTVYLQREVHNRLRIAALEEDTSTTKLVARLIERYLAQRKGTRGS